MVRQTGLSTLVQDSRICRMAVPAAAVTHAMQHNGLSHVFSSGGNEREPRNATNKSGHAVWSQWFQTMDVETTCVGECI